MPLDRFCRDRIYRPLGLNTLGFRPILSSGRAQWCAPRGRTHGSAPTLCGYRTGAIAGTQRLR